MRDARFFGIRSKDAGTGAKVVALKRRKAPVAAPDSARQPRLVLVQRSVLTSLAGSLISGHTHDTVRICEWCGKVISRWRLFARLSKPPLCSRKCASECAEREF
ncbi:MAG TPA: hypothetical protein VKB84_25550 [Candidatus Binataceae bacterium]|jgi:hypothetical protein|nr:hypothetical protein [Candidatus Binataceae bacterium]